MDPPSSTLEVEKGNLYQLENALSELFDKLLYVLADMDVFGRSNSPSMFIIYAHDSEDGGSSGAQYAKRIIKWLLALRSRILSDKSPLRSKREGGIAAARNILSNQFCLLPPGRSTDGSGDEITSVDKVILCGSEVLQRYYGHAFTASYINGIQELYDQAQHRSMLRESLQHEIREFVERQCQSEGFHHVLTELAFLALRRNSCGRDDDGIIPMRLSGDEVSYLPFITKCDLFLKVDDSPSMAGQHKLFFNLLRQLYADPSSHAIVDAFQDCYENVSKHLQGEVAITREAFRRIAYKEIFKAQTTVLHSRTADIRDEEWRQQWKAQTESNFSHRDIILDWLPKFYDVTDTHRDNLHQRQGQTGSWILADERYEKWKAWVPANSASDERLKASRLWCYGKPGAGKTIISSVIIEDLQNHIFEPAVAIAYIFCKHREDQTASSLILSLVAQLAHQHHKLSEKLIKFAEMYRNRKANLTPKLFECMEILEAEVLQFKKVFIVVDALDERLNDDHGYHLLGSLLDTNANVLITSRDIGPIADMLLGADSIEIEAQANDVTAYLNFRFQQSEAHNLQKLVKNNPGLQSFIVQRLVSKSDGMFLLARMHMDLVIHTVKRYPSELSAKTAVEALSSDLHEAYDEYMERIFKSESAEHARDVLAWVLFAREPVRMRVIQEAIAVKHAPKRIDNLIDSRDILGYCIGLVAEKGPPTDMVTFVHPDMERYFRGLSTSKKMQKWIPNGPQRIATSCLECLLMDDTGICAAPLWKYGAEHWGHHVQDKYAKLAPLISKYLLQSEKVSSAMQYLMKQWPTVPRRPLDLTREELLYGCPIGEPFYFAYDHLVPSRCDGSHVAAYFGIFQYFDPVKRDTECRDSNGWTPLWWAILGQQDATVKLLLKRGARANTKSNANIPLAIWMLGTKHAMEPTYILQNPEIVDYTREIHMTRSRMMPPELSYIDSIPRASGFTTQEISLEIIKALSGDALNARDEDGNTVLMAAARRWQCNIVHQLIDQGADISLRNNVGETAFLQALKPKKEHWDIQNVKVSRGMVFVFGHNIGLSRKTTLEPYSFGTLEATMGEMLMMLIPKDMAGNSEEGKQALRLAIANRHPVVVSTLLDRGANPNWQYKDGCTPLALACMPPDLLTFDISHGSIQDAAKLFGKVDVFTTTSSHAVEPFAAYESWHAAWSLSHNVVGLRRSPPKEFDIIVRTLLDKGADINGKSNGKTALTLAAENEYLTIFRTLLDCGADILKVRYNLLLRLVEVVTQFELSRGAYDKACNGTLQDFQTHDYCTLLLNFKVPKGKFLTGDLKCTEEGEGLFADRIEIELPLQLSSSGKAKRTADGKEKWTPVGEYERRVREKENSESEELLDLICSKIEEATQRVQEMVDSERSIRCRWGPGDIRQSWSRQRRARGNMGSTRILMPSGDGPIDCNGYETMSDPESSTDTAWHKKYEGFFHRWTQATKGLVDALAHPD